MSEADTVVDELDPLSEVGIPTDEWIEDLVRRLRRMRKTEPVASNLVRSFRDEFRALAQRRIRVRRRTGQPLSMSIDDIGNTASGDVREVLTELVRSPYGQAALWALAAMPILLTDVGPSIVRGLSLSSRHVASETRRYVAEKLDIERQWSSYWGSRRRYFVDGDGRRVPCRSQREVGANPLHVAAANACTRERVRSWLHRLDGLSDSDRLSVLEEMEEIGREACEMSAPLALWLAEPGGPRGLYPDPPPPDDDDIATPSATVTALPKPAPRIGRR